MFIGIGLGTEVQPAQRGFTPKQIPGLLFWVKSDTGVLDASDNPITVDGTAVKTWQDQSGNANHLTQATVANQPLYKTNQVNSRPGLLWDGTNNVLTLTTRLTTVRTVCIVHKWTDTTGDYRPILGDPTAYNYHGDSILTGRLFYSDANAGTLETQYVFNGTKYVNTVATAHNSVLRYTTFKLVTVATTGNTNVANVAFDRNMTGRLFKGTMAEILMYNAVLSTAQRNAVEQYLMNRYAL